jgi:maleate cis-trans isomerase
MRLGFLYPPCGAEDEVYIHGEAMGEDVRILLMGTRIFGDDDEHAPEHLSRTGGLDHLAMHARVMARMRPDAVVWACTSGSFIDGLDHALAQAATIAEIAGCPASSTSLAFAAALAHLGIGEVALLATYPEPAARAFETFLGECGIGVADMAWLSAPSGPAASLLDPGRLMAEARRLKVPEHGAILVPDTAMPSIGLIESMEKALGTTVLTANQVSLWEAVRLAEGSVNRSGPGRLFGGDR